MQIIKDIMLFDPDVSVYNLKMKDRIMERRAKLKEQGVSTYISSGAKASYQKKKNTSRQ
jgi:hypothetical protein